MKHFWFIFDTSLCIIGVGIFIYGVGQSQLGPHHRIVTVGTTVIADEMLTNPIEITLTATNILTAHGYETQLIRHTNQLWPVWSIFKK